LRVYLVDDHDLVRRGMRDLVAASREVEVVGEAASAAEAVTAIVAAEPDLMLLDLHLQDGTGIGVCRRVRSEKPQVRGVLLTASGDDVAFLAAVLADAAGYVVKLSSGLAIRDALRRAAAGRSLMDPDQRDRVVTHLRAVAEETRTLPPETRQVLGGMLDGRSDSDLIGELGVTRDDLDRHLDLIVEHLIGIEPRGSLPGSRSAEGPLS
jgi:two-component system response regulator DevR